MKRLLRYSLLALFAVSCGEQSIDGDLVIEDVNVIDLRTGQITGSLDILIKDSVITQIVNANEKVREAKQRINGKGKYIIPALWDMHVHIQDPYYLKRFLDFGIVGVRDMGGCIREPTDGCESLCPDQLNEWKSTIKEEPLRGPDLFIAGRHLSGTGWPTALSATSVEKVQSSFQEVLNSRVDFVKVYEQIPAEAYREIARLCNIHDLAFVGHVSESLLLSEISDMGQKSIEHLREQILYCFTNDPAELESFMDEDSYTPEDRVYVKPWIDDAEKAIRAFKNNNTWFTPTLAVQFARQRYADSSWINNPLRKQLPNSVNMGLNKHLASMRGNADKKGDSLWWMAHKKLVKRFSDEGIGILAGSDAACEGGIPGFTLHEELQLMVEAGLSPLSALQTATINPVQYFDLDSRGAVKEGYLADLILLDRNPLVAIENTLNINTVIRKGKIHTRN